jgi:hypothetical protein
MSSRPVQVTLRSGPIVAPAPVNTTTPTIPPPASEDEPAVPTEPSGRF